MSRVLVILVLLLFLISCGPSNDVDSVFIKKTGFAGNTGDNCGSGGSNCDGRECGSDGCGGSCGSCDDNDPCTVDSCSDGSCNYEDLCSNGEACCDGECAVCCDVDDCDGLGLTTPGCCDTNPLPFVFGGECYDLDSDPDNCGSCGNDCGFLGFGNTECCDGECAECCDDNDCDDGVCCDGECVECCDAGDCGGLDYDFPGCCNNECKDLDSDRNFCGDCDTDCLSQYGCNYKCDDGACNELYNYCQSISQDDYNNLPIPQLDALCNMARNGAGYSGVDVDCGECRVSVSCSPNQELNLDCRATVCIEF